MRQILLVLAGQAASALTLARDRYERINRSILGRLSPLPTRIDPLRGFDAFMHLNYPSSPMRCAIRFHAAYSCLES